MNIRLVLAALATLSISAVASAQNFDIGKIFGQAKTAVDVVGGTDANDETKIGREWAGTLLGAAPLVKNDGLQRYVNNVGRWIALHSERPELAWHFGVLDSPNINAFATPGGYVFVTRGLMERMRSEAELAGVLAHEIAHVVQKHHLTAIRKSKGMGLGGELLSEFGLKDKGNATVNERLIASLKEVMVRGLDKSDEYEADRMGVVLATRAGYDPFGLPSVLQTLAALDAKDGTLALLLGTHPAPAARLAALDKAIADRLDPYAAQPQLAARYQQTVTRR